MNEIVIITPPDLLFNDAYRILLISPNREMKNQIQAILSDTLLSVNVFLYDESDDNISWVLSLLKSVDITLIDIDNCDILTRHFASHIVAQPNTFYLTNDNTTPYNLISKNRVYDLAWLDKILNNRGNNE